MPGTYFKITNEAFSQLKHHDVVIGAAEEGGYYLLGIKKLYPTLFKNIIWSTNTVFEDTITTCNQLHLNYYLLPELSDIDNEKDLLKSQFLVMNKKQLVFAYNADNCFFSSLTDFAHKLLSPSTYQYQLCALTYNTFSINKEWKTFIENLPVKVVFLYKDEFKEKYKIQAELPAVYIDENVLLPKASIEQCKTLQELKNLFSFKLTEHDQHHYTHLQ